MTTMTYFQLRLIGMLVLLMSMLAGCGKNESSNNAESKRDPAKEQTEQSTHSAKEPAKGESSASEREAKKNEQGLTLTEKEMAAAGIKVAEMQEQQVNEQIVVTATIQANQNKFAQVAPRVAGRVTKVMVNQGEKVKQGQPLALIDSIEVGEAQSAYAQAATEQALAKTSMERAEKLYADQIIAQKEYLRVRADFEKAKAVLRAASEKRQALGVGGQGTGRDGVSVFAVSAPFPGMIIDKKAVLGELAQPDKSLFSIADLSTVWIETNLYEKDIGKVRLGAPAVITVAAYPGENFNGKVTYVSSVMDKESRTIRARVEVPNSDGRLKLDMFADAAITATGATKAMLLPDTAVVLVQGQPTVFVQEAGGFEARAVDLGDKLRNRVVLKSGVQPGENVVTSGAYALKAKMLKSQISAE